MLPEQEALLELLKFKELLIKKMSEGHMHLHPRDVLDKINDIVKILDVNE